MLGSHGWLPSQWRAQQCLDNVPLFPPALAEEVMLSSRPPVWLPGFVRPMVCTTSWVQDSAVHHRPALCIIGLRCAPCCTSGTNFQHMIRKLGQRSRSRGQGQISRGQGQGSQGLGTRSNFFLEFDYC